jgi:hypothetical protein
MGTVELLEEPADRITGRVCQGAAGNGKNVRVFERLHKMEQPLGHGPRVVIEENEKGPAPHSDAAVASRPKSAPRFVDNPCGVAVRDALNLGVVLPVVDNDDFSATCLERLERVKAPL